MANDPSPPAGPADSTFPLFAWVEREGGAVEVTIVPPAGRRLALASIAFAGHPVPLITGVVGAPADAALVVLLAPA